MRKFAITGAALAIIAAAIPVQSVHAQQAGSGYTGGTYGGGIFAIPNFESDYRSEDLYREMHYAPAYQWANYRLLMMDTANASIPRGLPPGWNAGGDNSGYANAMNIVGSGSGGGWTPGTGGGGTTTSVTGTNLTPTGGQMASVPDPGVLGNSMPASVPNFTTSVSGSVVPGLVGP